MLRNATWFASSEISVMLRVEGLILFVAAITAFHLIGGNWWLFAALILVPDLSMLGLLRGQKVGARVYNAAHTTAGPALLAGIAWLGGATWLLPVAVIWIAHIGMDRAVGFGLKYPDQAHLTHLGWIGKARTSETAGA